MDPGWIRPRGGGAMGDRAWEGFVSTEFPSVYPQRLHGYYTSLMSLPSSMSRPSSLLSLLHILLRNSFPYVHVLILLFLSSVPFLSPPLLCVSTFFLFPFLYALQKNYYSSSHAPKLPFSGSLSFFMCIIILPYLCFLSSCK